MEYKKIRSVVIMNNMNNWKNVYAALEIAHIPFKMYKKGDYTVFEFKGNLVELSDAECKMNYVNTTVENVANKIKQFYMTKF
jgi:hypothetical protein